MTFGLVQLTTIGQKDQEVRQGTNGGMVGERNGGQKSNGFSKMKSGYIQIGLPWHL